MGRLIDSDVLIENLKNDPVGKLLLVHYNIDGFIKSQPTVDAEPVRHGKWESLTFTNASNEEYTMHRCSECGLTIVTGWYHYCPNCGARMDKEDDTKGD